MTKNKTKRIYMDHAAAAPMDKRVKKAMEPYWTENFGNPNAIYKEGLVARSAIETAREDIAKILGARAKEIIFTNGGTESDNLAIFGIIGGVRKNFSRLPAGEAGFTLPRNAVGSDASQNFSSPRPHIITTKFEHHAVLNSCKRLEKEGFEVTYLDVGKEGVVKSEDVKRALRPETILVSIMYANNEIGTVQPIREIAKAIRDFKKILGVEKQNLSRFTLPRSGVGSDATQDFASPHFGTIFPYLHTDACQAPGYLDLNVERLGVDLLTLNGSKIYGPKGIGLLYAKNGIKLEPLLYGGEQERKLRPGTENVPAIVGLAEALKIADKDREKESARLVKLRDYFIGRLIGEIPKTVLNGHAAERLPNNINVSILDAEGESIVLYLDEAGVACSTGSACTSESLEPSHVIMAIGKPHAYAHGAMRFSLGRSTTKKDIDYVMKVLPDIIKKLRMFSPVNIKI